MSRFLVATYPSPGHVNPAFAVVEELTGRGHEVRWYTGRRFAEVVAKSGAHFSPMPDALDWDYADLDAGFPGRAGLKGLKQNKFDIAEIFVRPLRDHLPALKALLVDEPADVFVSHTAFYGGGWLHELGGPPNATLGDTCLAYPSRDTAPYGMGAQPRGGWVGHFRNRAFDAIGRATVLAPATKAAREVRSELGLPSTPIRGLEFGLSQYLHVQLCPRGFEYPRSDLPSHVHFVGAPVPPKPAEFDPPSWWPRLSESNHVVLVTQGTIATNPADLVAPCLEGLADSDVFVVATTGGADPALLGNAPSNAVVERFVPYVASAAPCRCHGFERRLWFRAVGHCQRCSYGRGRHQRGQEGGDRPCRLVRHGDQPSYQPPLAKSDHRGCGAGAERTDVPRAHHGVTSTDGRPEPSRGRRRSPRRLGDHEQRLALSTRQKLSFAS